MPSRDIVLAASGAATTFTKTITLSSTSGLTIDNSYLTGQGWDGSSKVNITFTVPNGVTISAAYFGDKALTFNFSPTLPTGSIITLNINSGGWIVGGGTQGFQGGGAGTPGGDAIYIPNFTSGSDKIVINNSGTIAGGGGSGGGWMTGSGAGNPAGTTYLGDYGTKRGGASSLYAGGGGNSTSGNTSTVCNASGSAPGTGIGGGGNGGSAGNPGGNFYGTKGGGGGGGLGAAGGFGYDNSPKMNGGAGGKTVRGIAKATLNNSGTLYGSTA